MDHEHVCRICKCYEVYTSKQPDHLILPCKCPGLCHQSCLEEDRKSNICEICNFEYKMEYKLPSYLGYLSSIHPYGRSFFKSYRFKGFLFLMVYTINEALYDSKKYNEMAQNKKNWLQMLFFEFRFWYYSIAAGLFALLLILSVIFRLCRTNKFFKIWQHGNKIWFVADQLSPQKSLQYNSQPHNTTRSKTFQEDQICRICSSSEHVNDLIKPCKCWGKIHRSCWQKTDHCEICQFKFKTEYKKKDFSDYLRENGYKGKRSDSREKYQDKCNPYLNAIVFIILVPIVNFSLIASIDAMKQAEKDFDSNLDDFFYYQLKREFYGIVSFFICVSSTNAMFAALWLNWKDFKSWQDEQEKTLMVIDQKPLQSSSFWRTLFATVWSKHQIADISRSKQVESSHAIVISEISVEEDDSISTKGLINKNIIDV